MARVEKKKMERWQWLRLRQKCGDDGWVDDWNEHGEMAAGVVMGGQRRGI